MCPLNQAAICPKGFDDVHYINNLILVIGGIQRNCKEVSRQSVTGVTLILDKSTNLPLDRNEFHFKLVKYLIYRNLLYMPEQNQPG
jgi:hypothetical protein